MSKEVSARATGGRPGEREGVLACEVHKVVAETFARKGFALGHSPGTRSAPR